MTDPFDKIPLGVSLARSGGVVTLLTADTGAAWALIFRTSACEINILAAGEDARRTSGRRPEKRAFARRRPRAVASYPGYFEEAPF